ncbi:MAG: glycosyltransferase [Steroidobacteraceae bacterium]|nr:glycosyltransferase [Steroidobacteraceae bacterium]
MTATSRIWITWETHRRSRGLSAALGATLHEINDRSGRLARYARSAVRTLHILFDSRGSVVFVQSPSIVLANLAVSVRKLAGLTIIIDAHNGGIDPLDGRSPLLTRLARRALRKSDLVIVTNEALARQVEGFGAKAFVLTDPMPDFPPAKPEDANASKPGTRRILAICTWASDEPYLELIRAATLLPEGCELAITGRPRLTDAQRAAVPPNVRLTGFVSEEEYVQRLRTADVIVDLTTRENCLLCGAYEAISVNKPLVVSDTAALRELLDDAAIYCANDSQSIADAIREALERREALEESARRRDSTLRALWKQRCSELVSLLEPLTERRRT